MRENSKSLAEKSPSSLNYGHNKAEILFLTETELAARWRRSRKTLQNWRVLGKGPAFVKIGNSVLYSIKDIEAYEQRKCSSTSQAMNNEGRGA